MVKKIHKRKTSLHARIKKTQPSETKEKKKLLAEYVITSDNVPAKISIWSTDDEYVPVYEVKRTLFEMATKAILNNIRNEVVTEIELSTREFIDPGTILQVKQKFIEKTSALIDRYLPNLGESQKKLLTGNLIHEMLGLGDIELLLNDPDLEEIVINTGQEPAWVYHKQFGWLKTSIVFGNDELIYNYASAIGRRVGRQITSLHPLMDAHLPTGDRVNATLFPISTMGNTLTIRKFSRSPWTIVHFIDPKVNTLSKEIAALLWLGVQYELNIFVVGGTASGKTSLLNCIVPFVPPNQRIISIEDTREIQLPKFLHWLPFSAREPNPEGKGGVTMLDLLINSLRMRPDRIVVGEIRRAQEAEVMLEAIRTGHSVYSTFHADRVGEAYRRLTNPPINLPEALLSALHLIVVQYRHRRRGIRRTLEVAELIPLENMKNKLNLIYRWNPRKDTFEKAANFKRIAEQINLYSGMSNSEIKKDLKNKQMILQWMLDNNIKTVNTVGKVFAEYYKNEDLITKLAKNNESPKTIFGSKLFEELKSSQ